MRVFVCREHSLGRLQHQEILLKGGESRNEAVISIFVGCALSSFSIRLGNLVKTSLAGVLPEKLSGSVRPVSMTKLFDIPYAIFDLTKN